MKRLARFICVVMLTAVLFIASVPAVNALSADVVMTVSRAAQDSIINEGENLTIEVRFDDMEPAVYRWFFEGELIEGAGSHVYSVKNAAVEDAGIYRMEAFAADGRMLASMEFSVRVIDSTLPQAGDDTLGAGIVVLTMAVCAGAIAVLVVRRRRAGAC